MSRVIKESCILYITQIGNYNKQIKFSTCLMIYCLYSRVLMMQNKTTEIFVVVMSACHTQCTLCCPLSHDFLIAFHLLWLADVAVICHHSRILRSIAPHGRI